VSDIIVDASVAVKWFVAEQDARIADEIANSGHRLFAPQILVTEVANALIRKAMIGLMSTADAQRYWRSLPNYLDDLIAVDDMIEPALLNACELRHPIYDLIYLEAARRLDGQLITADRRFIIKLANTDLARHVTLLSDWQPE
jgi:predicted nucleic acid-binding protein